MGQVPSQQRGEIVEVMTADGDWWIGTIGDCVGAFPSNYVCPLEDASTALSPDTAIVELEEDSPF